MAINVQNMTYPMGDDVDDVYYKMVKLLFFFFSFSSTKLNSYFKRNKVFLVRMDLKMGTGKIAAQTGHAGYIPFFYL